MPVQPTSAEVGESAVEGQTITTADAEPAAVASAQIAGRAAGQDEAQNAEPRNAEAENASAGATPADQDAGAGAAHQNAQAENAGAEDARAGAAPADRDAGPGAAPQAAASAVAAAAGKAWRAPGLDGVRALAVLAVLAFHESLPWIPGGFLGVDVFFVLSGYLITDLLVARFGRDGKIGLGGFYQRRARRLLPALALMLVTVTAAVSILEPGQRATLRPALLGAVTYTSNWWQALTHLSYFNLYGPPPAFEHLWSLAVEEQFYLIWPLLLAVILIIVRRPGARALFAWGGAIASALAMLAIYQPGSDPSLVYYGTDTHASALMIGAALAITWPLATVAAARRRTRRVLDIAGAAGLLILGWAAWHLSGADPWALPVRPGTRRTRRGRPDPGGRDPRQDRHDALREAAALVGHPVLRDLPVALAGDRDHDRPGPAGRDLRPDPHRRHAAADRPGGRLLALARRAHLAQRTPRRTRPARPAPARGATIGPGDARRRDADAERGDTAGRRPARPGTES